MRQFVFFLFIAVVIGCLAFAPVEKQKTYHLEFTETQVQALWYVIDKSEAEHTIVAGLQNEINAQLKAQQADTAKKK